MFITHNETSTFHIWKNRTKHKTVSNVNVHCTKLKRFLTEKSSHKIFAASTNRIQQVNIQSKCIGINNNRTTETLSLFGSQATVLLH